MPPSYFLNDSADETDFLRQIVQSLQETQKVVCGVQTQLDALTNELNQMRLALNWLSSIRATSYPNATGQGGFRAAGW